jgi:hypothetical protein
MRGRIATLLAVAAAVVAAPSGAGATASHMCTIEPYTYDVVASQVVAGNAVEYAATAAPMLTGATCPLDGRTITVREAAEFYANPNRFDPYKSVVGRYAAEWDLDNDGTYDVRWRGKTDGVLAAETIQTEMLDLGVRARTQGGAMLTLHQEGVLDLLNSTAPLQSLIGEGFEVGKLVVGG